MTTREEHCRNLGWTTSTLSEVVDGSPEGSELRERAAALVARIPTLKQIDELDAAGPEQVEAVIESIEAAHGLFTIAVQSLDDLKLRRSLVVTLRHYPRPSDFRRWRSMAARGAPMGTVILRKGPS
jgi:hypothetical protein